MTTVIRFDEKGHIQSPPQSLVSGNDIDFELIAEGNSLSDANDSLLSLRAESFRMISAGVVEIGFGADSVEVSSKSLNTFSIHLALNSMDAVRTAGGVSVKARAGGFEVYFLEVGSRSAFTVSHSVAGSLSGRCVTLDTGSASTHATFFLDLSVSVIAKTSTVSAISAATATISTVTTGDASNAQVQKLTISRRPDSGKIQLDFDGAVTDWFENNASAYRVQSLLDAIADGDFIVDRRDVGESLEYLITRTDKGASTALTVSDTFTGPVGLAASLDLSTSKTDLISFGIRDEIRCWLEYKYDGVTQFSLPVLLKPDLATQQAVV